MTMLNEATPLVLMTTEMVGLGANKARHEVKRVTRRPNTRVGGVLVRLARLVKLECQARVLPVHWLAVFQLSHDADCRSWNV